ncbi:MAG: YggS family pyridoxal phosphate-dependent enzyme [Lachnospiraceae bacterium]|nr:YggS family pyridoxal phosphate-dependent enzyme [Lachnospiraceae bacterium]
MIRENIMQVLENIAASEPEDRAGKTKLIAVSKTKPVSAIQEAYDCGIRDFGENKVQELQEKYDCLPADIRWHMIGHLQRNKVKYIIDKAALIHSVDSLRLAEEISKEAVKREKVMPVLIEVNIADEDSKFGVHPQDLEGLIRQVSSLKGVKIEGLMTVAPFVEIAEENRQYFQAMKQLSVDIMTKNIDNVDMNILSMGMTGDYQVAIQEGADYVRVGTGIFGERDYGTE